MILDFKNAQEIVTWFGPEDMALDLSNERKPRIILSCLDRSIFGSHSGKIQFYDITIGAVSDFEIIGYPTKNIKPHGIALTIEGENTILYVISHERCNKLLKFQVQDDKLIKQEYEHEESENYVNPNDVFVTESGHIYMTNPPRNSATLLGRRTGFVSLTKPNNPPQKIIENLKFPNGVMTINSKLFVTDSKDDILTSYQIKSDETCDATGVTLCKIKGGDNISLSGNRLLIAHHPNMKKFVKHIFFNTTSPSAVSVFNEQTKKLESTIDIPNLSGSSTAIRFRDFLYVSQVRGKYILKIPILD